MRIVQTAMTEARINWSLRFLMLMRCTSELIRGKVLARLLKRFWRRLKDFLWPFRLFWVSIAIEIWSLIMLWELEMKVCACQVQRKEGRGIILGNVLVLLHVHVATTQ
jgi:hypothetical protein